MSMFFVLSTVLKWTIQGNTTGNWNRMIQLVPNLSVLNSTIVSAENILKVPELGLLFAQMLFFAVVANIIIFCMMKKKEKKNTN